MQNIIAILNGIFVGGGGGGVAPAFSPSDIAGLKLWLNSDAANVNTEAAADFNGTTQYLSSNSSAFKKGNTSFSFGEWVYAENTNSRGLIGNLQGSGSNRGYGIRLQSSVPYLYMSTSNLNSGNYAVVSSSTTLSTNTWYFVAGVYDADADLLKIKVNGGAFNTVPWANGSNPTAGDFFLGALDATTWLLDGRLDLAFFYDKALTESELNALYNSGNATAYSSLTTAQKVDLVSWWSLSETSGTRYDQHGTNNLTDNGSVGWATGVLSEPAVDGAPVSKVINLGDGATSATQGTALNQPIYKSSGFGTNSKPYLDFDRPNSFMTLGTEYSKLPQHTAFTVYQTHLDQKNQTIIGDISSVGGADTTSLVHHIRRNDGNRFETFYGNSDGVSLFSRSKETLAGVVINTTYISATKYTAGDTSEEILRNGEALGVTEIVADANSIAGNAEIMGVGAWGDGSYNYLDGKIAEVLIYNAPLSASEILSVNDYLNDKYAAY